MLSNKFVRWIVVLVCVLSIYGCSRKSPPPEPTKTAAEYKAEADKQINEQNASQELSKLEQEVAAADANQP
jgi:predicted small lipoprotein YifL